MARVLWRFSWPTTTLLASLLGACGGDGNVDRSTGAVPGPSADAAASGAGGVDEPIAEAGVLLLDDLEDGDALFAAGSVTGEWFTYSDGTSQVSPPDHTGLGDDAMGEVHVVGEGFSDWGVGLSAYFGSADLSAFSGLRVRARGTGTLVVECATPATSPPGEGGTCMGDGCFGHYSTRLELGPDYQDHELAFADLYQPGWAQQVDLSLSSVLSINFLSPAAGGVAAIDFWLDDLALVAATAGE